MIAIEKFSTIGSRIGYELQEKANRDERQKRLERANLIQIRTYEYVLNYFFEFKQIIFRIKRTVHLMKVSLFRFKTTIFYFSAVNLNNFEFRCVRFGLCFIRNF